MEQVKLLSMTLVLTVLIWASADSLVNETVTVSVSFDVVPAPGHADMLVELDRDGNSFDLEVSGPRKTVMALQAQAPLRLRVRTGGRPTGPATLRLERDMLRQALGEVSREFRRLAIVSISPEVLPIAVDRMISREIEVLARPLALPYEVEPQLERSVVTVRLRETVYNQMSTDQPVQIAIGAELERLLMEKPFGRSVSVPVTLDARRFGPGATISPSTIEVTATVQSQRVTAQIPTVPILLAMSFANLERALRPVTRDGTPLSLVTQTITVSGQRGEVAKLQRGETRAYGVIQLKQEDLDAVGVLKLVTPDYYLPKGVELAQEPAPIEFKLILSSNADR